MFKARKPIALILVMIIAASAFGMSALAAEEAEFEYIAHIEIDFSDFITDELFENSAFGQNDEMPIIEIPITEMLADMGIRVDLSEASSFSATQVRVTARNVPVQSNSRYPSGLMAIRGTINSIDFTYCLSRSIIVQIHSQVFATHWTVDTRHYRNVAPGTARVTGIINWVRDHTFDGTVDVFLNNGVPVARSFHSHGFRFV